MRNTKYRIQKDLVFLTIFMCIIVFLWIGSNIYNAYVTSTIDEALQLQIIPIDGRFNVDAIEQLKNRTLIEPDYSESIATETAPTQFTPTPQLDPSSTLEILPSPVLSIAPSPTVIQSSDLDGN